MVYGINRDGEIVGDKVTPVVEEVDSLPHECSSAYSVAATG